MTTESAGIAPDHTEPTLAEDLLLLFQPGAGVSGTGAIAGEGTLFYALAGALVTELALDARVQPQGGGDRFAKVEAVVGHRPADALLRRAWDYVAEKPRGVQTVLAAIGPTLREPVLERVVARGDIRRGTRRALGLFETTVLEGDGGERRARLIAEVRAVLVDGVEPSPRVAALAALLSGSGTLPQFDQEIPWGSAVVTRAKQLEQGDWGAGAAAEAVARTVAATVVNSVIVAMAVSPRG
ncbi:GOLPH3/VPS74 family protein [Agrococcus baldri]|uniref:Golgi phosphoprotein 3 (GPP34) n=1 Tax=Agrococcus baldri TaxID=153730 RepID=A0AA87RBS2_9MICO|nr:GPP34 family phosphoprotein [Agrococcus baldri]GEK80195.1 hypothetical protein ABA31_15460 [Agrococcus baldri]